MDFALGGSSKVHIPTLITDYYCLCLSDSVLRSQSFIQQQPDVDNFEDDLTRLHSLMICICSKFMFMNGNVRFHLICDSLQMRNVCMC